MKAGRLLSNSYAVKGLKFKSSYNGRYYRNEVSAVAAMLEIETGEPASLVAASVWLDREADARNSRDSGL